MSRLHLIAVLAATTLVWLLVLVAAGEAPTTSRVRDFGLVASVVAAILFVFDRWGWRARFLYPWFVTVPDLNGTWKGSVLSSWSDGAAGPTTSINAYLVIRQTFRTLDVRLLTENSASESVATSFTTDSSTHTLHGVYRATPRPHLRDQSPIHFGAFQLQIPRQRPFTLRGECWTSRKTTGEQDFRDYSSHHYADYESAHAGNYARLGALPSVSR